MCTLVLDFDEDFVGGADPDAGVSLSVNLPGKINTMN